MLKKLDHIGIAVADLAETIAKYRNITGKEAAEKERIEEQKVSTAFFSIGETRLELLQGTQSDSPIAKFVARQGEGVHHLCFEVTDLRAEKKKMAQCGLRFIENIPETGAGGSKVAFIHPKSTGGVLIELVEYPDGSDA
ncbi:MAG: methylmalonyl-CoA epimerase [bacterium]